MRISARADYALRAAAELAANGGGPVKGDALASAQKIPHKFLENILADLRHARLVRSQRGADGGYWLAQPSSGRSDSATSCGRTSSPRTVETGPRKPITNSSAGFS